MEQLVAESIAEWLSDHLSEQPNSHFAKSSEQFLETGFALVSYLLPGAIRKQLADEIRWLVSARSVRRDLWFKETSGTARLMRNVSAADIEAHRGWIAGLYSSETFLAALSRIAGEPVLECPYLPERYIITHLERSGDTHGWHWDDYAFGVIYIVDCPPVEAGGFVQCVNGTSWDKGDPKVFRAIIDNPIRSYELSAGDLYILRTDTTLHRVHPITEGTRTIVNFAFAAERDLEKKISHGTMENLFCQQNWGEM